MKRDYNTGKTEGVVFFYGKEVEHTPAYGLDTLFVTGIQSTDEIAQHLNGCRHIFFGANHSFNPKSNKEWVDWELMIKFFV